MNSSYESLVSKITSKEISDVMLELREWFNARELADLLRYRYPGRKVEVNDVYKRLVEFSESSNAHCKVDMSVRPRRFRLVSIRAEYFNELRRQLLRKGVAEGEVNSLLGNEALTEQEVIDSWKYAHDMWDAMYRRNRTCRLSVVSK
ncbi:hypothetical protein ACK6TD_19130 [Enterobacter hormaechei]|uniref:hypothetical protein n=1 Tax=Enterobacter hormaechei TaxID=158836 RepID=UPI003C2CA17A